MFSVYKLNVWHWLFFSPFESTTILTSCIDERITSSTFPITQIDVIKLYWLCIGQCLGFLTARYTSKAKQNAGIKVQGLTDNIVTG